MRYLVLLGAFIAPFGLWSQIPNVTNTSATVAANFLSGPGVTISNISFSGVSNQVGIFSDGSTWVGFEEGVVLTTGKAKFAESWQTSNSGDHQQNFSTISDPDLDILNGSGIVKDAAALEFDFETTGSTVQFEFVFGSDEYIEWVGSGFNDAFGFFLSGPGYTSGPYTGGAENIAELPTGDPVTINTVNHVTNSAYFIQNTWTGSLGTTVTEATAGFAYDGWTEVITVTKTVQCIPGATYHLKLAICNTNDHNLDSGVFLKKGSLRSDFELGPLTADIQPICEGQDLTLTVIGDNGWTYDWSTGDSGLGLRSVITTADPSNTSYTVTATNVDGCQLSQQIDVIVHDDDNLAPYVNGISNTGEYTAYVNANSTLCFDIPSFDTPTEPVTMVWNNAIAGGSFNPFGGPQETGQFCWTPNQTDVGLYSFDVTVTDGNVCGPLDSTFAFFVKVICEDCPEIVYYENRTPTTSPLPASTTAGAKIVAGTSVDPTQTDGPVETGIDFVDFIAPQIDLQVGFTGGPNFNAIIDPGTCLTDCETFCCDQFSGFSFDTPFANVITPNGDGVNDFWYLGDVNNPFCAFGGATKFRIEVHDPGVPKVVYVKEVNPVGCCPFEAPAPSNPIPHSSIFWDGTDNTPLGGGAVVQAGSYEVLIRLWSPCGDVIDLNNIQVFSFGPGKSAGGNDGVVGSDRYTEYVEAQSGLKLPSAPLAGMNKKVELLKEDETVQIFPNPVKDHVNVVTSFDKGRVHIYSITGEVLETISMLSTTTVVDLSNLSSGMYLIRVQDGEGNFSTHSIVKQ